METEFIKMFFLIPSDPVSRLTEMVKGNSGWSNFYKWYAAAHQLVNFEWCHCVSWTGFQVSKDSSFCLLFKNPTRIQKPLLVIEHGWLTPWKVPGLYILTHLFSICFNLHPLSTGCSNPVVCSISLVYSSASAALLSYCVAQRCRNHPLLIKTISSYLYQKPSAGNHNLGSFKL